MEIIISYDISKAFHRDYVLLFYVDLKYHNIEVHFFWVVLNVDSFHFQNIFNMDGPIGKTDSWISDSRFSIFIPWMVLLGRQETEFLIVDFSGNGIHKLL